LDTHNDFGLLAFSTNAVAVFRQSSRNRGIAGFYFLAVKVLALFEHFGMIIWLFDPVEGLLGVRKPLKIDESQ